MSRKAKLLLALLPLFVVAMLSSSCKKKQYLTGYYSYDEFRKVAKWETFVDEDFKLNEKYMDSIQSLKVRDSLYVKLFLGTYCGDSKKWVPRFYRVKPMLPVSDVQIISVDTTKKDAEGLWKEVKLEKIPTFIFYDSKGREVGRIVEKPKGGIEKQLYQVLKKAK